MNLLKIAPLQVKKALAGLTISYAFVWFTCGVKAEEPRTTANSSGSLETATSEPQPADSSMYPSDSWGLLKSLTSQIQADRDTEFFHPDKEKRTEDPENFSITIRRCDLIHELTDEPPISSDGKCDMFAQRPYYNKITIPAMRRDSRNFVAIIELDGQLAEINPPKWFTYGPIPPLSEIDIALADKLWGPPISKTTSSRSYKLYSINRKNQRSTFRIDWSVQNGHLQSYTIKHHASGHSTVYQGRSIR
jgi:hypothetical protein